jgi:hypothetical protein
LLLDKGDEEESEDLGKPEGKFGEALKFSYVDIRSQDMKKYPEVAAILNRVRLPLTIINGEPRFHGGLSINRIEKAVGEFLVQADSSKG